MENLQNLQKLTEGTEILRAQDRRNLDPQQRRILDSALIGGLPLKYALDSGRAQLYQEITESPQLESHIPEAA